LKGKRKSHGYALRAREPAAAEGRTVAGIPDALEWLMTDPYFRQQSKGNPVTSLQGYDLGEADLRRLLRPMDRTVYYETQDGSGGGDRWRE
jgi:hypothetical protein